MTKNIPIFAISDQKYAMCLSVMMVSIVSNTSSNVDFYILDGGIDTYTKNKILELKDKFSNIEIEFIKIDKNLFKSFPNIKHFSLNAYFRYLIPTLKPELKKVLYIDADIIVKGDILKLYNHNLETYPLAAVPVIHDYPKYDGTPLSKWGKNLKKKLGLNDSHIYFNSGLLIIDCEYARNNCIPEKLFKTTTELADLLECADQDVFNKVFENNYKVLDDNFNIIVYLTYKVDPQKMISMLKNNQECLILHFTGGDSRRPWNDYDCILREAFWENARKSPFAIDLMYQVFHLI